FAAIKDPFQIRHIKDVLRFKRGDPLQIFDGRGNIYKGKVTSLNKNKIEIEITQKEFKAKKSPSLTLAVAIPKDAKMDYIVEKLTELAVDKIIPLLTGRTIVRLDENAKKNKVRRWQKISLNAAEQSQRPYLVQIEEVLTFKEVLLRSKDYDLRLIPTLWGERKKIKEFSADYKNILVFIGPEGDFTPQEVSQAQRLGFIPVDLGETVLKVDTAAISIAAFFNFLKTVSS
ncbi:MAG: 16S rRNA (uracil(1498)-N(3))-methyltransferase, partial [Candidatus Omnitrophica bacterium]|nr:16S rRNA (uracil(1498)-N(3))-methyltransferase [Candidatus Omnitrophota bacterium]